MGGTSCYAMTMGTSSEKPLIMGASSSSSPSEGERGKRRKVSSLSDAFSPQTLFSSTLFPAGAGAGHCF